MRVRVPTIRRVQTNRKPSSWICLRLAENLIRLRKARGLTQRQLADASGFKRYYISDVEQGRINISLANLEALTVGLHCSPVDLFSPAHRTAHPNSIDHDRTGAR